MKPIPKPVTARPAPDQPRAEKNRGAKVVIAANPAAPKARAVPGSGIKRTTWKNGVGSPRRGRGRIAGNAIAMPKARSGTRVAALATAANPPRCMR